MRFHRFPLLLLLGAAFAACESFTGTEPLEVRVELPAEPVMLGDTVEFSATLHRANGLPVRGREVTWLSSDPGILRVGLDGRAVARGLGTVQVIAKSSGGTGTAAVQVHRVPVVSVTISGGEVALVAGRWKALTAVPEGPRGQLLTDRAVSWSSSDTLVAAVRENGLVVANGTGTATIRAVSEQVAGEVSITVSPPPLVFGVQYLGTLGGESSSARGINNHGDVVGSAQLASGEHRAFLWTGGRMRDLGAYEGMPTVAHGLNDRGEAIGAAREGHCSIGLLWRDGEPRELFSRDEGTCGWTELSDINSRGMVLARGPISNRPFLWHEGEIAEIREPSGSAIQIASGHALNEDGGVVVRSSALSSSYVWSSGSLTEVPGLGGRYTWGDAINDRGHVAGFGEVAATQEAGLFIWRGEGTASKSVGVRAPDHIRINNSDWIIASDHQSSTSVLVMDDVPYRLQPLVADADWRIVRVYDLNDVGQIVGEGRNLRTGETGAILLSPWP